MYPANTNTSTCSNFPHFFSKAQLHRERIELLQHHTTYNTTDTELMLYRRVRIRRQKRLAWNMITQREAYVWKLLLLFDCDCGSWFFFVCGPSLSVVSLLFSSVSSVILSLLSVVSLMSLVFVFSSSLFFSSFFFFSSLSSLSSLSFLSSHMCIKVHTQSHCGRP